MEKVTLTFDGKDYTVDADSVWGLIEAVEDVVTLVWLSQKLSQGDIPSAKIFRGYVAALRYAGASVTMDKLKDGVDMPRLVQMGYELAGILSLGMPSMDVELPKASAKKKPAKKS